MNLTPLPPKDDLDARIHKIVDERLEDIKKKVDATYDLLVQLKGAGTFAKVLFFIIAPTVGAIVWLKDHVKL